MQVIFIITNIPGNQTVQNLSKARLQLNVPTLDIVNSQNNH